ncbi:Spindle assembly checkpoint component MAD1 [Ceratocystis fimbriata CBS 114723]|uniref:Spindle assembly checkpoint component MAD1 n=1 Tax=Ceratocystis fimbriata CBS 114723 TaxID=1035309 RepID=A0A2C5XJ48_9PEZI|nr:Spindle assembly checkpoint component MAD1 [Ceratocystis fimbriata CBS 114723]
MRKHTLKEPGSARPASRVAAPTASSRFRSTIGPGSIPRPRSNSMARTTNFHSTVTPSYNLLTGESLPPRPGSRAESIHSIACDSSKENIAPADAEGNDQQRRQIEQLKAELATMRHRISVMEDDHARDSLRHTTELEDQKRRAQEDFEKKQAAESESVLATRQTSRLQNEIQELRDAAALEKSAFEKRLRSAEDRNRELEESMEELGSAKDDAQRRHDKTVSDLQMQLASNTRIVQELEQETQAREEVLQKTQALVTEKDEQIGRLEADVLRLKAQTGDVETMAIIKRELSDQVSHIRSLEASNRDYITELKHLRQVHKAVEIVEEEKRTLQRRLETAEDVERQLGEAQIQIQRLEEEQSSWTSYLRDAAEDPDAGAEFSSPEEVARALVQERLNAASMVEKIGGMQAEMGVQDSTIKVLQEEKIALKTELEKAKSATAIAGDNKAVVRLDRQRALAVKEVEYLRAQLKSYDVEDVTFNAENHGDVHAERIQSLEKRIEASEQLVDQYKAEVQTLHADMSALEAALKDGGICNDEKALGSLKRSHADVAESEEAAQEKIGEMTRKLRSSQDELAAVQTKLAVREKDVIALMKQLESAKKTSKVRILALRNNPTAEVEKVKMETLHALQKENAELLAVVQGKAGDLEMMPVSQLAAVQRDVTAAKSETASAHKSIKRLKEVWAAKSLEFKEAIFSTLGWTVVFMPNGKMRVESTFYPSVTDEHENSIVFDGERGTMKVGGGPKSEFAQRISSLIQFWVRDKGCIPGFLAALTLEFYDERAGAEI